MSDLRLPQDERLLDLLATRATQVLSQEEAAELTRLSAGHPDMDPDGLDAAAAALYVAWTDPAEEELSADLRTQILAAAPTVPAAVAAPAVVARPSAPRGRLFSLGQVVGFAAAAAVLAAVVTFVVTQPAGPAPVPTLAEQRQDLIDTAPDLIRASWKSQKDARFDGVEGDVVWSTAKQQGYMRLRGIPANDPRIKQYQLWIVDPGRDKNPVDGGVFDVPAVDGDVIIPIDAKIQVDRVAAFALTLEKPGGVVVSGGPLLVVAPTG